jgi:exopolysaccharide biosynthesis polyprenyl glycosylphosphotransferase
LSASEARWWLGPRRSRPGRDAARGDARAPRPGDGVDLLPIDPASADAASLPHELAPTPAGEERRWSVLRRLLALADVLAGAFVAAAGAAVLAATAGQALALVVVLALGWPALTWLTGVHRTGDLASWASGIADVRRIVVAALLLSWALYAVLTELGRPEPGTAALTAALGVAVAAVVLRGVARSVAHRIRPLQQRTLIVGSGLVAGRLVQRLERQAHYGLRPVGLLDDEVHVAGDCGLPALGCLGELETVLREHRIERVIIAFSRTTHEQLLACVRSCREQRVAVSVVPRLFDLLDGAHELDHVAGLPLISISAPTLGRGARAGKRLLDLAGAGLALVAFSPVLALIALAIKLESRGPVFFRQERAGRGGRPFRLVKFRSMYDGADAAKHQLAADLQSDVMFKMYEDPRVTRVGRWLRRTSIDELPQLFNVLRGEMSLVGPRPIVLGEHEALEASWQLRRVDLRPGLTGPWQVYGRSHLPFDDMVRYDYQYVLGWSLTRDVELLLATIPAVLAGRGAY